MVQGNFVFAAGAETDDGPTVFRLLRFPLQGGAMEKLGGIAVTNVEPVVACADDKNYYLGTRAGILVFSKETGVAHWINHDAGLPSDNVTALDCLNNKLYAGLGDSGYLVEYDLETGRCETLASARRREQVSPFDNGSPLRVTLIAADRVKRRVLFLTDQSGGSSLNKVMAEAEKTGEDIYYVLGRHVRSGLWAYEPAGHHFRCLQPRWPNADSYDASWVGKMNDTQMILVSRSARSVALYDWSADNAIVLSRNCVTLGISGGVEDTLL